MAQRTQPQSRLLANRNNVIIAAGISIFVVAIAIFTLIRVATQGQNSTPNAAEKTVASFYAAVKKGDYVLAYTYLADQQQALITADAFKLSAQQIDEQDGTVTDARSLRFDNDRNAVNQAIIQEQVTRSKKGTYTVQITVVLERNGDWKILQESGI